MATKDNKTTAIVKQAAYNALATTAYVTFIGAFLSYVPRFFGKHDTALIPVVMLLLLVCSAGLTGSLVFGQPILWYIDGKKKEAFHLLRATLGILFCITMLGFAMLYITSK